MPIGVGINENVVLKTAAIDDKGKLTLTFEDADTAKPKTDDEVFDSFSSAKVENDGGGFPLNIFPFKKPSGPKNENKTEDELIEMVSEDMKKVRNQLTQLLEQYLVSDAIKWDPFAATGIDKNNYRRRFLDDDALAIVFKNYASQFIAMATPFFANPVFKLRVKLVRQSKEKHYALIPGRFLVDNPWVELMDVPKEQSKVKFTKWEIANGYNDGTPVAKSTADVPADLPEAAENGPSVFGQRA